MPKLVWPIGLGLVKVVASEVDAEFVQHGRARTSGSSRRLTRSCRGFRVESSMGRCPPLKLLSRTM